MGAKSLGTWLTELEQLHPSAIDLGLARCGEVAQRLGLLSSSATTITVAGTNGKGSTVAVMEALLCEQGVSCGAFTSPHLIKYNERIRVNGAEVGDEIIVRAFEAIDAARGDISLTYFEFGALAALWVFRELGVAYQLLEVGLGGRLDAVNIIDADVAVVTAIGLDHQEWLGSDVETIAIEKCGIARSGRPCIVADEAAPATVMQTLNDVGGPSDSSGCRLSILRHLLRLARWAVFLLGYTGRRYSTKCRRCGSCTAVYGVFSQRAGLCPCDVALKITRSA